MRAKKFSSFKETNRIAFSPLSHPLISWLNVSASKNYPARTLGAEEDQDRLSWIRICCG
jgi:hypothetical protein